MTQFSLEKYLENPSRKVVTRDGRQVRIVCWDLKSNTPIIAAIQWNQEREDCYCYNTIGRCANNIGELDLFFADEEKELTEFEKAIKKLIESCCNEVEEANITNAGAKEISSHILDLARKEIQPEIDEKLKEEYDCGYSIGKFDAGEAKVKELVAEFEKGRTNALKDLPKWKKITEEKQNYLAYGYLSHDGYYLSIQELKDKLPKEE